MDLGSIDKSPKPDTAIGREFELKLVASPKAVRQLRDAPRLAAGIAGLADAQDLIAAYYDTADLRLRRNGLSLRVRKEGDRFIQTIKSGSTNGGGALKRLEWNAVVPDLTPRPDWVMDGDARGRLGHLTPGELIETCRTRIRRETRVVAYPCNGEAAIIEVALDIGTLESGKHSVPAAEVGLELLKGPRQAVYALALELNDIAPLHVERRSKAERAYRLFTGEPPQWQKGKKLAFAADATVDSGIAAILESCFAHWLANEPVVLETNDPEGVHQMRVALRRLRSALLLFDAALPVMQANWLKQECKWLAGALGPARNWDVFLAEVLAPIEADRLGDPALAALRAQCERARARHYESARATILSPRYTNLVLNLGRWLDEAGWRIAAPTARRQRLGAPLRPYADGVLDRRYRKVRKGGRRLASATPEARHSLRIAIKKLRYASEFFASLYKARAAGPMIADIAQLQDHLGNLNDLAVTERQLETIVFQAVADPAHDDILRAVGLVVGWGTARVRRDEGALLELWQSFRQRKPFWKRPVKR